MIYLMIVGDLLKSKKKITKLIEIILNTNNNYLNDKYYYY